MDKTFNFFKTKTKTINNDRPSNNSKSNSSKASYSKKSDKVKQPVLKPCVLTKREKQIREAIEMRYQKSKLRLYEFARINTVSYRALSSSRSGDIQQYRQLKGRQVVDLKQYHLRRESISYSNESSREKKFHLRLKLRQNTNQAINVLRTEPDEVLKYNNSRIGKNRTINSSKKTGQEWGFISIEVKEDMSKFNNRKTEVSINSQRSCNVQPQRPKLKTNSSVSKYLERMGTKWGETSKSSKFKF